MKLKNSEADYGFPERQCLSSGHAFSPGQLVRSLAGRDKGELYLVVADDGAWVWVADGRKRGIANPKRKNRRHLQFSARVAADFNAKAATGTVTNEEIRAAIQSMLSGENRKEGK